VAGTDLDCSNVSSHLGCSLFATMSATVVVSDDDGSSVTPAIMPTKNDSEDSVDSQGTVVKEFDRLQGTKDESGSAARLNDRVV
jgi:hypothetical protein